MLIHIDHHSGVPAYRQLMEQIRYLISSGQLRAGDDMPSTRSLSSELDLNPMTISKAYSLLEHEGALERRRGKPLRVRALENGAMKANKEEQLRKALGPAVTAARQLGFDKKEAVRVFTDLIEKKSES